MKLFVFVSLTFAVQLFYSLFLIPVCFTVYIHRAKTLSEGSAAVLPRNRQDTPVGCGFVPVRRISAFAQRFSSESTFLVKHSTVDLNRVRDRLNYIADLSIRFIRHFSILLVHKNSITNVCVFITAVTSARIRGFILHKHFVTVEFSRLG